MNYRLYNYRYALEIVSSTAYAPAWDEIDQAIRGLPLFQYVGKSRKYRRGDVSQHAMNTYFDRVLSVDYGWDWHPLATGIVNSNLRADFRKRFGAPERSITIQAEVQFGNMARWYSDVFKFQTAYSQKLIQMGLCIVPVASLAARIDQNVVNFERVVRELPMAELSITLPIVVIGVFPDEDTPVYDVSSSALQPYSAISGRGREDNRYRVVNGYLQGTPAHAITTDSPVGRKASSISEVGVLDEDEEDEDDSGDL